MLFLLLQLGDDRYALKANQIVEVLPLLQLKKLPQSPTGVAGVMDYRNSPVPVLDLSELAIQRPSKPKLSTRIVVVNLADGQDDVRLVGLIAENVTETLQRDPGDFVFSGIESSRTPYLGPVVMDTRGMIQWVKPAVLLPAPLYGEIFKQSAEVQWQASSL
ncbi:MAG: chemotaxis protein CheW [Acidobacteriaceae bacterium]|nr:chemotaxis protein CheW [Acidobacteriaceae bacterium]